MADFKRQRTNECLDSSSSDSSAVVGVNTPLPVPSEEPSSSPWELVDPTPPSPDMGFFVEWGSHWIDDLQKEITARGINFKDVKLTTRLGDMFALLLEEGGLKPCSLCSLAPAPADKLEFPLHVSYTSQDSSSQIAGHCKAVIGEGKDGAPPNDESSERPEPDLGLADPTDQTQSNFKDSQETLIMGEGSDSEML